MTLLATAGIYLVLDVNSPLPGQHLNRYEPWTTYTTNYVNHVFDVVNEFSGYNNTLAFFAGNEIINDKVSASNSPIYVKAIVRDIKYFIKQNHIRKIPIGYSAADDLAYRISLAEYLECYEKDPLETIDFYGVNTYQWCGDQTFSSSGYDHLVKDYSSYSKPIFFSEYGCNEVLPRKFNEVEAIYSNQMTSVFSGGLVYEFAQEANNYGLVDYDESGNVKLLSDFVRFKQQISKVKSVKLPKKLLIQNQQAINPKTSGRKKSNFKLCDFEYNNLDISKGVPKSVAASVIKNFVSKEKGKFVSLTQEDLVSAFKVFNPDGSIFQDKLIIKAVPEPTSDPEDLISCEYCDDDFNYSDDLNDSIYEGISFDNADDDVVNDADNDDDYSNQSQNQEVIEIPISKKNIENGMNENENNINLK